MVISRVCCVGLALLGLWFAPGVRSAQPDSTSASTTAARQPVILVVGDSLSAGYGVPVNATWVTLLGSRLAREGYGYRVVNASVSGETTGGARARLPRALQIHQPKIVLLELGGNDGLYGRQLTQVKANLEQMIRESQQAGAQVMLIGMRIPTNYGAEYADGFFALYGELAQQHRLPVVRFFLDGVIMDEKLMQTDGIHPTAAAQPKLLDNVWPVLQTILTRGKQ